MAEECRNHTFTWTNIWEQSSSESKVMQRQVKDDVLQEHPTVNDTPLSPPPPPSSCVSLIGVVFHPQTQRDYKVTQLFSYYTNSPSQACALLGLHIQILPVKSHAVGCWFPQQGFGFCCCCAVLQMKPSSATSSKVWDLLGDKTGVWVFSLL